MASPQDNEEDRSESTPPPQKPSLRRRIANTALSSGGSGGAPLATGSRVAGGINKGRVARGANRTSPSGEKKTGGKSRTLRGMAGQWAGRAVGAFFGGAGALPGGIIGRKIAESRCCGCCIGCGCLAIVGVMVLFVILFVSMCSSLGLC